MGIQLISISHKTAPVEIRGHFTFDDDSAIEFMRKMKECEGIDEVVLLSTCNRTEIYCSGQNDSRNLRKMQELLLNKAGMDNTDIPHYIMRYSGENAVHHLFKVAAGLDSALLGENQILGQVKNAFFIADRAGMCKSTFHTMFQSAITAAKEVNTKTVFSKTPISSAGLSVKQMQREYGSLAGRKIMIIGASGKLGEILFKDVLDIDDVEIYVTTRQEIFADVDRNQDDDNRHQSEYSEYQSTDNAYQANYIRCQSDSECRPVISQKRKIHGKNRYYHVVPYKDRYLWMQECDIVVSATKSPHYTVRKDRLLRQIESDDIQERKRLFFDLAVPQDMDEGIGEIKNCIYYSLEDIEEMAKKNIELKKDSIMEAKAIIKKYEEDFIKEEYYRKSKQKIDAVMENILKSEPDKGINLNIEKKLRKIFYIIKKDMNAEEFIHLLSILEKEED